MPVGLFTSAGRGVNVGARDGRVARVESGGRIDIAGYRQLPPIAPPFNGVEAMSNICELGADPSTHLQIELWR